MDISGLKSKCCNAPVTFRDYSRKDLPVGSREMLLTCTRCGAKNQAREGQYSHCYMTKCRSDTETKSVVQHHRLKPSRLAAIKKSKYGSSQNLLDTAPL